MRKVLDKNNKVIGFSEYEPFTEKEVQEFIEDYEDQKNHLVNTHTVNSVGLAPKLEFPLFNPIKVKFKKLHKHAKTPQYAKNGDAAMDLTSISDPIELDNNIVEYHTGIAVEIPTGFVGLIFPRSSICGKTLSLTNSCGIIDSGFRGEIKFKFRNHLQGEFGLSLRYKKGERIGQLMIIPYPKIELEEVNELSQTERGNGGFGSSGK